MNNDNGGPAFPVAEVFDERQGGYTQYGSEGMTLRDYFAIHVDSSEIDRYVAGNEFRPNPITREQARYAIADAMLKERAK